MPFSGHDRSAGWRTSHLKTFYAWLFKKIRTEDLRYEDKWIDPTSDLAIMWPIIEMAGPLHSKFIPDVLYVYNLQNPLNDCKVNAEKQAEMARMLAARPPYKRLEDQDGRISA